MASLAINDLPDGRRVIVLSGRLDAASVPMLWDPAHRALSEVASHPVDVDTAAVDYCDGAGMALLVDLVSHPRKAAVQLVGMQAGVATIYHQFDPARLEHDLDPEPPPAPVVEEIGRETYSVLRDLYNLVAFVGQLVAALGIAIRHPGTVRWRDVWRICERTGADALPIVSLLSFLLGVILAFQSAVPMKRFGAEIFVADLLGLAVLRELGPLMTAILLAGRSGAAFAAEIGTMTVNQEVDALTTMGLDPVQFLVTPRIIAAVLMTPLLTLFANLVALAGGALTMQTFSIPLVTFFKEVDSAVDFGDFMAGFVKSFVFALLIAGVGCLRGLQTQAGASAVGDSATRAVVSGIILLVVVDGIFAVIYFVLDI
jgi:phospholipid/cholesterol/gamma-HCH transport system permease protein